MDKDMKHLSLRINVLLCTLCLFLSGMAIDTYAQSTVSRQKKTENLHKKESNNTYKNKNSDSKGSTRSESKKSYAVSFTSNPTQADLYINGKWVSTTPHTYYAKEGEKLNIICKKSGYIDKESEIIANQNTTVKFNLDSEIRTITITSSPVASQVLIDGVYKGTTPYYFKVVNNNSSFGFRLRA